MADDEADTKAGTQADAKADVKADAKTDAKADKKVDKKADKAAAKADRAEERRSGRRTPTIDVAATVIRTRVAQLIWLLCVLAALLLALGALIIALEFNQDNAAVDLVLSGAESVDLGVFTRTDGLKEFGGANAATKNALVNYGLGALFWLVVGRVADRIVRP